VIVGAGSSARMGGQDKLAQSIGGRSVLELSVGAMRAAAHVAAVVVVARADQVEALSRSEWLAGVNVVAGGARRSDSVRNGVAATNARVVLVHDAARPLATSSLADAVAAAAAEHGAAVPVIPVVDSLKRVASGMLQNSLDRTGLVRTQTPQGARRDILVAALAAAGDDSFSDEAALLESQGVSVATVAGEPANLKITEPADIEIVRAIAQSRAPADRGGETRIGLGQDTHGFGPESGLLLGGLLIDDAPRLYGHSDGDVVLHALATAILSACALGDLGRLFPSSDTATAGIGSDRLVAECLVKAGEAGWSVTNVQLSLVGARPKLGATRLDGMRDEVARLLATEAGNVSITASTGNLYGAEGAGLVISATCVVLVHRR
jgi:2-C-methyl-D-erythritol 4-phosphate cytidylyltransferase/2-C-methyl-D-erythritol 2,4-cyclodiphosphate synthase